MSRTQNAVKKWLPDDYKPSDDDVAFGRGSWCNQLAGNKKFREHIGKLLEQYHSVGKLEKQNVTLQVLDQIRSNGGMFIQKAEGAPGVSESRWYQVEDSVARQKISQAFRDRQKPPASSSNQSSSAAAPATTTTAVATTASTTTAPDASAASTVHPTFRTFSSLSSAFEHPRQQQSSPGLTARIPSATTSASATNLVSDSPTFDQENHRLQLEALASKYKTRADVDFDIARLTSILTRAHAALPLLQQLRQLEQFRSADQIKAEIAQLTKRLPTAVGTGEWVPLTAKIRLLEEQREREEQAALMKRFDPLDDEFDGGCNTGSNVNANAPLPAQPLHQQFQQQLPQQPQLQQQPQQQQPQQTQEMTPRKRSAPDADVAQQPPDSPNGTPTVSPERSRCSNSMPIKKRKRSVLRRQEQPDPKVFG